MAIEEPLKQTPAFDAYKEIKKLADDESLQYFKKWVDIINLEQSANNVNILAQYNSLSLGDKGAIKDMNLMMTDIEVFNESDYIIISLER